LYDGEIIPDRDCVLSWKPLQPQDHPTLQVMTHHDPASGQVYFLALVMPPAVRDPGRVVPREVILLVDHSGSMQGPKWEAADWAVKRFLSDLTQNDAFALGLFHNTTKWFYSELVQANQNTVESAIRFLEGNRDSGGTELGVALEQALSLKRTQGERSRHVLIVTDAQVTDEGRLLRLASEEANRSNRRRISLLCVDAAPNAFLASELAERGGGVAKFLTSNPQEDDITTALDEVLAHWAEPVLVGLRLEVNRQHAQAAGQEVSQSDQSGWSAIDVGDLPAGRSIWVAGRVPAGDNAMLTFRLASPRHPEVATQRLRLSEEKSKLPAQKPFRALKALFGARRILGLEFLIHSGYAGKDFSAQLERLGYDPEKVLAEQSGKPPKIYAENVRADTMAALRELLIKEALDYGLACSETAFVAVRQEAGKPVEASVAVTNALPAGWSDSFLSGQSAVLFAAGVSPQPIVQTAAKALRVNTIKASKRKQAFVGALQSVDSLQVEEMVERHIKVKAVFSGIPQFSEDKAILFDSFRSEDDKKLPAAITISMLEIRFPAGTLSPENVDPDLSLLLFVDDLAVPRAKVRLVDLIRQGMKRPLHLSRRAGQMVRVVLLDPNGAWKQSAPKIEVLLG
jgi:Ca-activated chloride channel family protein